MHVNLLEKHMWGDREENITIICMKNNNIENLAEYKGVKLSV